MIKNAKSSEYYIAKRTKSIRKTF